MQRITALVLAMMLLSCCYVSAEGEISKTDDRMAWNAGDTVIFGTYPQTAEGDDETPIEWIVLDVQENEALLISKYALDCKPYHNEKYKAVTWETCTLREWLNDEFFNKAFSEENRQSVINSKVTTDKNPSYGTKPGKDTEDNVFLLSIAEANRYFRRDKTRICYPTAYAKKQGAYTGSSRAC